MATMQRNPFPFSHLVAIHYFLVVARDEDNHHNNNRRTTLFVASRTALCAAAFRFCRRLAAEVQHSAAE